MFWVSRISDLFNHNELDDIKDRKDKFKRYKRQAVIIITMNHNNYDNLVAIEVNISNLLARHIYNTRKCLYIMRENNYDF